MPAKRPSVMDNGGLIRLDELTEQHRRRAHHDVIQATGHPQSGGIAIPGA